MRHIFRGTMLVAALALAGCDRQAQNASSPAVPDAAATNSKNVVGDVAAEGKTTDQTGRVVINPQFDEADSFSDGLAAVGVGGKFGYIDKQGKFVITPPFEIADLFPFSGGLAAIRIGEFL